MSAPPPKPGVSLPAAPKPAAAPTPAKPPLPPAPQFGQKPAAPPAAPVKELTYGVIPAIPPKPQTTPVKEPTYGVMPVIQPKTTPAAPGVAAGGAKPPIKEPTPAVAANAPVKEPTYGVLPIVQPKPGAPPPAQSGSNENKAVAQTAAVGGGGGKSVMGGVGGGQSKMDAVGGGGEGVRRGPSKGGQSKMGTVGGGQSNMDAVGGGSASVTAGVRGGPSKGGQSKTASVRTAQSKGGQTQSLMEEGGGQGEEQEGNDGQAEEQGGAGNDKPTKEDLIAEKEKLMETPLITKKRCRIEPTKTFEEIKPHRFFSYETEGTPNRYCQYKIEFDQKQLEMMIDHDKKVVAEDLDKKREVTKGLMKGNWRRPMWKERLMQTMVFKIIYLMGLGMTLTFMTICLIHMSQSASEEFIGIGREDPTIWDLFMVDLEFDLKEGRISDAGWASASLLLAMCIGLSARFYWKEVEYKAYATSMLAESRYFHCLALQELRRGDMDTNFEMKVKAQMKEMRKAKVDPEKKTGVVEVTGDK